MLPIFEFLFINNTGVRKGGGGLRDLFLRSVQNLYHNFYSNLNKLCWKFLQNFLDIFWHENIQHLICEKFSQFSQKIQIFFEKK